MKRGIHLISIMFLVLICTTVSAEVIFDEWVRDGKPFMVNDDELRASFRQQNQKGTIFTPSSTFLVDSGHCELKDLIKYCIEDVDYENAVYEDGKEYPLIRVIIKTSEPAIAMSQTFSTTKPRQFERIEAQITIINTGELRAEDLRLEIPLPSARIVSTSGGSTAGNSIIYETYLLPGQEKTYKYVFEPRELIDFDVEPKVTYRFFDRSKTIYGDGTTIKVKLPFDFEEVLSDDALKRGETIEYNISFANTAERGDVEIEPLTVTVPSGLSVVAFTGFTKDARTYTYSDKLRKEEEGLLTMTLRAESLGDHDIIMDARLTAEGQTIEKRSVHTIQVSASDVTPYLIIEQESVRSDSGFTIKADLKNRQSETLRNVRAAITFNPPLLDALSYPGLDLRSRQRASVVQKEIMAPQVDDPIDMVVTLSGSYVQAGSRYQFETSDTIRVEPFVRPLSVTHRFNETPRHGGNLSIIAAVKNLRGISLPSVSILDAVKGIKVIDGKPYADFGIAGGEEKEFSYAIHIPEDHGNSITIDTFMNAEIDSEFIKVKTSEDLPISGEAPIGKGIPVKSIGPQESQDDLLIDEEDVDAQRSMQKDETAKEPDKKEEKGFFARILGWFAKLLF